MEKLNAYLDDVEFENNLDSYEEWDDDTLEQVLYLLQGEKEYRRHLKGIKKELAKRAMETEIGFFIDVEDEDERDD